MAGALASALGAPVEVGALGLGPRADLTLERVRIAPQAGGPTIARIVVDPDARRVLRGEAVVNQIALDGVVATLEASDDGMPVVRGVPGLAASGGESAQMDVREVVLRASEVTLVPPPRSGIGPRRFAVDRLVVRQVPTTGDAIAFLGSARGALDGVPVSADATLELDGGLRRAGASVTIEGERLDAHVAGGPTGPLRLRGSLSGSARWDLDRGARRNHLSADLRASDLELRPAGDPGVALTARRAAVRGLELDLAAGWRWRAAAIEIEAGRLAPYGAGSPEAEVALEVVAASLREVGRDQPGRFTMAAETAGGGTLAIDGRLGVDPLRLDASVAADALPAPALAALLGGALPPLSRGRLRLRANVTSDGEHIAARGSAIAEDVHTAPPHVEHPEEVLAASRVEAELTFDSAATPALSLARLVVASPYAMIQRRDGALFPASLGTAGTEGAPPGATASVAIDDLRVIDGRADFVDRTPSGDHWTGLASLSAVASGLRWPEATAERLTAQALHDELSPIRLAARAEDGGVRIELDAERLSLPSLNPFLAGPLGFRAERGRLDLDADGVLRGRLLAATGALSLSDLGLVQTGLDAIGAAIGVPLPVALALLEDHRGAIDLEVPFEIDVETGETRVGSLVAQAIGRAVRAAVSAPIRLLGLLFGTDGPPQAWAIDPVPFPAGSGALDAPGERRAEQIARVLAAHDDLLLVAKAQLSAEDRARTSPAEQEALALARVASLRTALGAGRGDASEHGSRSGSDRIAAARIVVAPWSASEHPDGDPIQGVYVEVQSR